ncbi:MAG: type II secretion system protein [Chloroflexota bacterium]|nr:type II secretion system protein [Chloroflexota bacterium]
MLRSREAGIMLLETLVALAVLGVAGVAFVSALGTVSKATTIADERAVAESLVRSQLEYVGSYAYQAVPTTYPADPTLTIPAGWTITSTAALVHVTDDGIQKVTVQVTHLGKAVLSVVTYKVNR